MTLQFDAIYRSGGGFRYAVQDEWLIANEQAVAYQKRGALRGKLTFAGVVKALCETGLDEARFYLCRAGFNRNSFQAFIAQNIRRSLKNLRLMALNIYLQHDRMDAIKGVVEAGGTDILRAVRFILNDLIKNIAPSRKPDLSISVAEGCRTNVAPTSNAIEINIPVKPVSAFSARLESNGSCADNSGRKHGETADVGPYVTEGVFRSQEVKQETHLGIFVQPTVNVAGDTRHSRLGVHPHSAHPRNYVLLPKAAFRLPREIAHCRADRPTTSKRVARYVP